MILKNIIYLDNSIKICFVKINKEELTTISPDFVQYVIISYSIGLVNKPCSRVQETIKIEKKDIFFINNFIITSFHLDGLLKPEESEIMLNSLTFFLKDKARYKVQIGKTQSFRNIESDTIFIDSLLKKAKKSRLSNSSFNSKIKKTSRNIDIKSLIPTQKDTLPIESNLKVDDTKQFINSYEQFKSQIQDTNIQELLKSRPSTLDFNLKNFGISLLSKLLLLTKYVNELVDNDFQKDLHEFLRTQILDRLKTEVTA